MMQIRLEYHGTLVLFQPLDGDARAWLQETAPEEAQFVGDALAVESRYVHGVIDAFVASGGGPG